MHQMHKTKGMRIPLIAAVSALSVFSAFASDRPELTAYPYKGEVAAAGTYEATTVGTNFVVTGTIDGDVTITATEDCRVTLSSLTMSGVLTIDGDAQLWLDGDSAINSTSTSAVTANGALCLCGTGTATLTATPTKKKQGVIIAESLTVAGGTWNLNVTGSKKNASGIAVTKKGGYTQLAGTVNIVATEGADDKQNGIYLAKDGAYATISGGILTFNMSAQKGIGIAMAGDDDTTQGVTMTGGVIKLAMSGDGAKGIKGDGEFTMSGGIIDAEISGGYVEELYQDEDETYYYYITVDDSTMTSGDDSWGSDSVVTNATCIISNGTYAVYDPSKAYAVKVGTLNVTDGTMRIRCTGTCGRGLGADNMYISGGVFDISVTGGTTPVYFEPLDDSDPKNITVCLDSGGASCLKTSGTNSVLSITGGSFELLATGDGGKLVNAGGYLIIGEEGSETKPGDSSFSPDIQGQVLGSQVYCTYFKQKYYGSIGTAVATTSSLDDLGLTFSVAQSNIVVDTSYDEVDYSNAKGIKAKSGVTFNGGRYRLYTANDGGEGLESKDWMTINGGVIEMNCADDCINTGGDLVISNGYIYAASTANDAIDSNANIEIDDGWIYCFTLSNPEEAIDVNSGYYVTINGGYIFGCGAAQAVRDGTLAGTQGYYQDSSGTTLSTNATYYSMSGDKTVYAKMPAAASSTTGYIFCSVPGMTTGTAPTSYGTTKPSSATSDGFHDFYYSSSSSGSDDDDDSSITLSWTYYSSYDCYYVTGISYCTNAANSSYETMGIYVPSAYVTSNNGTYTINTTGTVNGYTSETAPVVVRVETSGYSAQSAPSGSPNQSDIKTCCAAGFIYLYPGCRGRDSGAPLGVTDLKAAVRYYRYLAANGAVPSSTDRIFAAGHSGGGAQSAILAASGDSSLYDVYLNAIGARMDYSDAIAGACCWCPITNLEQADAAYEWNMGLQRSLTSGSADASISAGLAAEFAEYINAIGFKNPTNSSETLALSSTSDGYYQSGTYYQYVLGVINDAITKYNATNGGSVATYDITSSSALASFASSYKHASKGLGAFDDYDSSSSSGNAENQLFGQDGTYSHFDTYLYSLVQSYASTYASNFASDLATTDAQSQTIATRLNMYSPLYYICDNSTYYGGYGTATVAPYWRIRTGANQEDTALCTEINLALALEANSSVKSVDFGTVWAGGHNKAEYTSGGSSDATANLISWINSCLSNE